VLKKIAIADLTVDMYVAELIAGPNAPMPKKKKGMVRDHRIIDKFLEIGIEHVVIDVTRGRDFVAAPSANQTLDIESSQPRDAEVEDQLEAVMKETSTQYRDLQLEWGTAKEVFATSVNIVMRSIASIKNGEKINATYFREAASAISRSIQRNKDALTWLGKLRDTHSYLYEHSVNTGILMGVFCHAYGLNQEQIQQCITGALLHDLGQAKLEEELFERPGPLSEEEYTEVKSHVHRGVDALAETPDIQDIALSIVREHHERYDGSGYPEGLEKSDISLFGRMFAIVDTYDAVTNNRAYKEAVPSSFGMRTLLELANTHFDEGLVHQFIKCMGIYPTGSLVKLNNGILAVVIAQIPGAPLKPLVKLVYSTKSFAYVKTRLVDLSKPECEVKVASYEDPRDYQIKVNEFMPDEMDF